jgi:MFS family permease
MAEVLKSNSVDLKQDKMIRRNIKLYSAGNAVSLLGTYMYNFAIGLYVLKLTGSGASLAFAILFGMVPRIILSPFAGALADRLDRKKLAVSMDILSGLLMITMFLVTRMVTLSLPLIYMSSALLTVFNTLFSVSIGASVPNLVDEKRLMKINSLRSMIDSSSSLVGPMLGGIVYAVIGIQYFLLLNGISFICSGISEMFMNFNIYDRPISEKAKSQKIIQSMKEGFAYLKGHDFILGLLKYVLFINFITMSLTIYLPYTSVEVLKASSTQYGFVQMGFPLGILFMSILYSAVKKDEGKIFYKTARSTMLFGLVFLLFALPASPIMLELPKLMNLVTIALVSLIMGAVIVTINIPLQVMMQKSIDDAFRGRVGGVLSMASQLISPLGVLIFGFLIDQISPYILPIISGIMILSIAGLMLKDKKMLDY